MKMVFVVRSDLKMGKGKIAAQVAHAAIELYKKASTDNINSWEYGGSKKVTLKVTGADELQKLRRECASNRIKTVIINDAGYTQVPPGSETVLGIGPVEDEKIDRITGILKIL